MADRQRPNALTVIAILALTIGALGLCVSSFGLLSLATQDALQDFSASQLGGDPEQQRLQREMQEHVREATADYMPFSAAHQVLNLLLSFGLLGAGVLLLRWHPKAPALFTGVAVANLALDVVGGALGVTVQMATSEAMRAYLEATAVPGAEQLMGAMAEASVNMGICTAAALFLAKAAYYVWGIVYLRREDVAALFRPEAHAGPPAATPPPPTGA